MKQIFVYLLICTVFAACDGGSGDSYASDGKAETGTGGSMARFAAKGDFLYAVGESDLKTFDISNAELPIYLTDKDQRLNFGAETIFPIDSLLFIGTSTGMYIYSVKKPAFPQFISHVTHITSCDPVVVSGNYAYVTLFSGDSPCNRTVNELHIYDVSDIYEPKLLHSERGFIRPRGLGIDGKKLFICDNGLKVYDVTDPLKPVWVDDASHIKEMRNINPYDVIPLGGTLLLVGSGGFYQLDYSGDKLSLISSIPVVSNN